MLPIFPTMTLLAGLIFLLSPVAFLAGLVNPRWVLLGTNPTRYTSSLIYSVLFIISTVVVGASVLKTPQQPVVEQEPAVVTASSTSAYRPITVRRFYPKSAPVRVYRRGRR